MGEEEWEAVGPAPEGEGEEEGEAGAVAEEVEFVEFFGGVLCVGRRGGGGRGRGVVGFRFGGLVEEFFGKDVLRDEDEGAGEGTKDAEEVTAELDAAG